MPLSYSSLPLVAYLLKDWRMLCIVSTAPYFFILVLMYKFIPESVKWLHATGQTSKAMEVLKEIAQCNQKELPFKYQLSSPCSTKVHVTWRSVKGGGLFMSTALQCLMWTASTSGFYGVMFAAHKLPGNIYTNSALLNICEVPTSVIAIISSNKFGRKKTNLIPLFITGFVLIIVAALPSNHSTIKIIIAIVAKFFAVITYNAVYLWSAELFPTEIRSRSIGICEFVSRSSVGFVVLLTGGYASPWVVFIVLGVPSIIASLACTMLPETKPSKIKELKSLFAECKSGRLKKDYEDIVRKYRGEIKTFQNNAEYEELVEK